MNAEKCELRLSADEHRSTMRVYNIGKKAPLFFNNSPKRLKAYPGKGSLQGFPLKNGEQTSVVLTVRTYKYKTTTGTYGKNKRGVPMAVTGTMKKSKVCLRGVTTLGWNC